jgi:hypothetical protein
MNEAHAAAVGHVVHLGKLEVRADSRNLKLARYIDDQVALPTVPASVDWSRKVTEWPMYGNDTLGDCTCAAVGHMEEAWSANEGSPEVPSDTDVTDLYWATGRADTGRYCLDVLNYWQSTGFGSDGEKILAFAQIDQANQAHVEFACWAFGGVYIGVQLPKSAQTQREAWTVTSGPDADVGSWGGHCVNLVDFTSAGPTCVTWGRLMPMTWAFFAKYCDEAYAVISPDFLDSRDRTPSGFDLEQLTADLAKVTSTPVSGP